jgi:hypothetical protein
MDQETGALIEKRALQVAVAVAALVPLAAGGAGAFNPALLGFAGPSGLMTHAAYLSGLLLGLGLAFGSCIPGIETKGARFGLLTLVVVTGGLARVWTATRLGIWGLDVTLPLLMELGATPALWLWQRRVARFRG